MGVNHWCVLREGHAEQLHAVSQALLWRSASLLAAAVSGASQRYRIS
jgi:hypothetical protein